MIFWPGWLGPRRYPIAMLIAAAFVVVAALPAMGALQDPTSGSFALGRVDLAAVCFDESDIAACEPPGTFDRGAAVLLNQGCGGGISGARPHDPAGAGGASGVINTLTFGASNILKAFTPGPFCLFQDSAGGYWSIERTAIGINTTAGITACAATDVFEPAAGCTTPDTTSPTVTVSGAPATLVGRQPFSITITFSEDVTGFAETDLAVTNASVSALAGGGAAYTATITPTGSGDVTIDVPAGAAHDGHGNPNTAAQQVIVRATVVEATQNVIASFLNNRLSHIANNQPDIGGMFEGSGFASGGPLGFLAMEGNSSGLALAFATSLAHVQDGIDGRYDGTATAETTQGPNDYADRRVTAAFERLEVPRGSRRSTGYPLAFAAHGGAPPEEGRADSGRTKYDLWTEIHGSTANAGTANSSLWVVYAGGHYFVSRDLLVGGLIQVDWARENDGLANVNGTGWMAGPYIAWRTPDRNLLFEGRAAWGQSSNSVTPFGTYTDAFGTTRWMAYGKVTGYVWMGSYRLNLFAAASYFEETQHSYVDALSNVIPAQTVSLGELRFGPSLEKALSIGEGTVVSARVGASGVYSFGVRGTPAGKGSLPGNNTLRAKFDLQVAVASANWRLLLDGYYDGVGAPQYEAYGGKVRLSVPLR